MGTHQNDRFRLHHRPRPQKPQHTRENPTPIPRFPRLLLKPTLSLTLALITLVGLSGCDDLETPSVGESPSPSPIPSITPLASAIPENLTLVTVYGMDDTCENLVPRTLTVPKDEAMVASVRAVVAAEIPQNLPPVSVEVTVTEDVAQVSLQTDQSDQADSQNQASSESSAKPDHLAEPERSLASLSSCENRALYESIERTLLAHEAWGIRSVDFPGERP